MKKKLEAELISIAHRILKLKNKSELAQLHQETQKLYEKLSVLRFVEENFADVKPTIGYTEIEEKIAAAFDQNSDVSDEQPEIVPEVASESDQTRETPAEKNEEEARQVSDSEAESSDTEIAAETSETTNNEPVIEAEIPEETVSETEKEETSESEASDESNTENLQPEAENSEPIVEAESPEEKVSEVEKEETAEADSQEEIKPETSHNDSFKPSFELAFDPKEDPDTDRFNTPAQTSLEDFLHDNYVDPVFVTPEDLQKEKEEKAAQNYTSYQSTAETPAKSLNDRMAKGIIIGLNDRIAFMNHLFNNSSEDYNRVLSQLMTIDTFSEAKNFIDTMVKPDYNNWNGKEEYEQRFMEIIEKKFS